MSAPLMACCAHAQDVMPSASRPAVPLEPIGAILDAFHAHRVVGMGDGISHGDEFTHRFRQRLIRDPRFAATVNDIVFETGNAHYQRVIDRYVNGESVAEDELRKVWQDTSQVVPMVDAPVFEEFYRTVREVNASLPRRKRLRVLLADPPIDWSQVKTREEVQQRYTVRAEFSAELIRREVLAKDRRALVVIGAMHLQRHNLFYNFSNDKEWLLPLLERTAGIKVFNIWVAADVHKIQADAANWPLPSVAMLRGTPLGQAPFTTYYPAEVPRTTLREGAWVPVPREQWRTLEMERQFDAILSVGPKASIPISDVPLEKCADPAYLAMRTGRLELMGMKGVADTLRARCFARTRAQ